eukprot:6688374-Prymnesium_polylepis.3
MAFGSDAFASGRAALCSTGGCAAVLGRVSVTCASTGHMEPRGCTLQFLLRRIQQTKTKFR